MVSGGTPSVESRQWLVLEDNAIRVQGADAAGLVLDELRASGLAVVFPPCGPPLLSWQVQVIVASPARHCRIRDPHRRAVRAERADKDFASRWDFIRRCLPANHGGRSALRRSRVCILDLRDGAPRREKRAKIIGFRGTSSEDEGRCFLVCVVIWAHIPAPHPPPFPCSPLPPNSPKYAPAQAVAAVFQRFRPVVELLEIRPGLYPILSVRACCFRG
jgi:hypothetical protein